MKIGKQNQVYLNKICVIWSLSIGGGWAGEFAVEFRLVNAFAARRSGLDAFIGHQIEIGRCENDSAHKRVQPAVHHSQPNYIKMFKSKHFGHLHNQIIIIRWKKNKSI